MATLRHKLGNIISVSHSMLRLSLMKVFYPRNVIFSAIERISPNVVVDTDKQSRIHIGNRVSIHSRGRITSTSGGNLSIGDRTSFNVGCIVVCRHKITIGKNVSFGPNVLIYDHNHIMDPINGVNNPNFALGEITIGDNSWIGAGSIILQGTHIGNNCAIAAGSVVKGNVPDNTVLIQKRTNTYRRI